MLLEQVIRTYRNNSFSSSNLSLSLLTRSRTKLRALATRIIKDIPEKNINQLGLTIEDSLVEAGSGSLPEKNIESIALRFKPVSLSVNKLSSAFRDLDNPSFKMDTKVLNYYANVNVRYNLYNNWNTQRSIKIAKIQKEILELDANQLKLNLKTSLNNYYSLFQMRSSLLDVSAKNLEFASKSFLLAQKKYNQGVLSSVDLLIFKNNLLNAKLKFIESEYNKLEIYLQIKRLTGDLLLDYN